MGLTLLTPAHFFPLTLEELKAHVSVAADDSSHDAVLNECIADATDHVSVKTSRQLITATYTYSFAEVPDDGVVKLLRPPLQSVVEITYIDADGEEQTVDEDDYQVITSDIGKGKVIFDNPPTTDTREDAITITYLAGYGNAEDVPGPLKRAIRLLAADWFYNREATTEKSATMLPTGVDFLLFPYLIQELH